MSVSVVKVSKPEVSIMEANGTGRVLQCVSGGWYPEPELEWRDSEGRLLPADVTQTHRHPDPGPHQRYTVTSRVTVQKTGWFTCRVHLQGLNQTKETKIHVPGEVLCYYCWFGMLVKMMSINELIQMYLWRHFLLFISASSLSVRKQK